MIQRTVVSASLGLCEQKGGLTLSGLLELRFGVAHAKFPQLRPMKVCLLVLEPHFCCQIGILATHTSHLPAQIHDSAL